MQNNQTKLGMKVSELTTDHLPCRVPDVNANGVMILRTIVHLDRYRHAMGVIWPDLELVQDDGYSVAPEPTEFYTNSLAYLREVDRIAELKNSPEYKHTQRMSDWNN